MGGVLQNVCTANVLFSLRLTDISLYIFAPRAITSYPQAAKKQNQQTNKQTKPHKIRRGKIENLMMFLTTFKEQRKKIPQYKVLWLQ